MLASPQGKLENIGRGDSNKGRRRKRNRNLQGGGSSRTVLLRRPQELTMPVKEILGREKMRRRIRCWWGGRSIRQDEAEVER